MESYSLDRAAQEVLSRYSPPIRNARLVSLGNYGGFSGASLWRVESDAGPMCLRAWPTGRHTPAQLHEIHHLLRLAHEAGLRFIPAVHVAEDGLTWVSYVGRLWDVMTWMPGRADFHERPTQARLEAVCMALAQLHLVWAKTTERIGHCPAICRRLDLADEWLSLMAQGWQLPHASAADASYRPGAERAWKIVQRRLPDIPRKLASWSDRSLPLQPCLCDIWHDNVLFEENALTGMIDFADVQIDHVAADLARLLGSLVEDDAEKRNIGLRAYARLRPLSLEDEALIAVLDETGTVLGLVHWLKWFYREDRPVEYREAGARRLEELVRRVERW